MEGMNRVMLYGALGADPELRMTSGGTGVLKLRLATTERYQDRDKQWKERTEWHRVVVWGKRAEGLGKILTKGSVVLVEGSLRTTSYDDKDGNKRYTTEIQATNVLLGGGNRGGNEGGSDRGTRAKRPERKGAPPEEPEEDFDTDDDQIPF